VNQNRKAILSAEGKPIYRYVLWREWDESNSRYAMFVGLNPSTADETNDDPTIGRCVSFAKDASCGALCMTNLFAFRTKSPALMKMQKNISPVGLDNDDWLLKCAQKCFCRNCCVGNTWQPFTARSASCRHIGKIVVSW
jgi:hypothetical protein